MTLVVEAKVRNYIRGVRSQLGMAFRKLNRNPCVRIAVKAGADWLSFAFAGLSLCVLIIFFILLVLGPYITFTFLLYEIAPWSKSSSNHQAFGFLVFFGSSVFVFMGYRLFTKYPQFSNMDNLSKIESIPTVFQICVYYAFWSFCSMIGSLLTYDFLVASYSIFFSIFNVGGLIFHMMSCFSWYFLLLLSVLACILTVHHYRRGRGSSSSGTANVDYKNYDYCCCYSRPRTVLPV